MNRSILDVLGRDTLVRLMRDRGLGPARDNDERRKSLAHSYHGDVEALIGDLTRQELVDLFKDCTFVYDGVESFLSNPPQYRHDELRAFALRAFAGRRVRIPAEFMPVDLDDADVDDEDEDEDDEAVEDDFDDPGGEDEVSAADALGIDSADWSRPRQIARILDALGHEPVERLRAPRFQALIAELSAGGLDACLADDESQRLLTPEDDSPGIHAKLRLRLASVEEEEPDEDTGIDDDVDVEVDALARVLETARSPMRARDIAQALGVSKRLVNPVLYAHRGSLFKTDRDHNWSLVRRAAALPPSPDGGPRIVVQSGEGRVPVQTARPSDYNLALLRLQFLTAVPSPERRTFASWPDGFLAAATKGLTMRAEELALLRVYSAGLCIGNHTPYDAIPRLSQVLSPNDWEDLLSDLEALNPFQPEVVQLIVEQVAPVMAPRSSAQVWRQAQAQPPDLVRTAPHHPAVEPRAASAARPVEPTPPVSPESPNRRDLGALAGMFDED